MQTGDIYKVIKSLFEQVGTAGLKIKEKSVMPPDNPTRKLKRDVPDEIEEPVLKKAKTDSKQIMNKTDTDLSEIRFSCEKPNVDGEKFNVKICSWNVSGIRAVIKVKLIAFTLDTSFYVSWGYSSIA